MARPPETTILAEVSSGRSSLASASPENADRPGSAAASTASIGAVALPFGVTGNAAVRTVMTFTASEVCTVWIALPA